MSLLKKGVAMSLAVFFLISGCSTTDKMTAAEPQMKLAGPADTVYQANWKSLGQRPIPGWFEDAKFGIFIHWGPYSVPAYSPKGTYSEWYQHWLQDENLYGNGTYSGSEVTEYHQRTYGEDFTYYQFANEFKADLFDPQQWANLFQTAGAKYVVLTSKHHDGYALWPSEEANDRGFAWNSVDTAAQRDLVGDLSAEVKKAGLKMGLYYSLYEWYHPNWQKRGNRSDFVEQHFHPQVKDLVENYEPDLLWADGEWVMSSKKWRSPELIAWLFNESKVKDTVVINDRWGKETRHSANFPGFLTTEYESEAVDGVWEECRGMGFSFAYNQNEDLGDYASAQSLVLTLVDVVSKGGNLLLDIGPDGRGKIPVIMQERLTQIGAWLDSNGEAIYGTRKWQRPSQWSEGDRSYKLEDHYIASDYILKLTVDPEPGYAVKQVFFTQKATEQGNNLYAILPAWPGAVLVLEDVQASSTSKITLLATGESLSWKNDNGKLVINMPVFDPNRYTPEQNYAYTLRISHM